MLRTSSYSNQHRLILYITHIYPLMGGSRVTSSQRQWDSSACSLCTPSSEEQDGSRIEFSLLLSKYCLLNFAFFVFSNPVPKAQAATPRETLKLQIHHESLQKKKGLSSKPMAECNWTTLTEAFQSFLGQARHTRQSIHQRAFFSFGQCCRQLKNILQRKAPRILN